MIPSGSDPIGGQSTGRGLKVVLAVVAAVALIGIALAIRGVVNDDGGGSGSDGPSRSGLPRVACTPDLQAICDSLVSAKAIAADVESLDLDRAGQLDQVKDLDGWITWDPAPEIANLDQGPNGQQLWERGTVISSSPLNAAVLRSSSDAFGGGCGPTLQVKASCLVEAVQDDGIALGVGEPSTAEGLARWGAIVDELIPQGGDATELDESLAHKIYDSPVDGQGPEADMARDLLVKQGALDAVIGRADVLQTRTNEKVTDAKITPERAMGLVLASRAGQDLGLEDEVETAIEARRRDLHMSGAAGDLMAESEAGKLWQLREKVG